MSIPIIPGPGARCLVLSLLVLCSAPLVPQPVFTITEKAPTRAFSWLGPQNNYHEGRAALRHYANRTARVVIVQLCRSIVNSSSPCAIQCTVCIGGISKASERQNVDIKFAMSGIWPQISAACSPVTRQF